MIFDQATALRELKKLKTNQYAQSFTVEDIKDFFRSLPSPANFKAIALVVPEIENSLIPPLLQNISFFAKEVKDIAFWDQAGVINSKSKTVLFDNITKEHPTMETLYVETPLGMLRLISRLDEIEKVLNGSDIQKVLFIKELLRNLKSISELWITFRASEIQKHLPLLLSTDLACIIVPMSFDFILKSYEAVKSLHLHGYFSTFGIVGYEIDNFYCFERNLIERIQMVARQFLSIDLQPAGIMCNKASKDSYADLSDSLRKLIDQIDLKKCDFYKLLFEQILSV